VQVLHFDTHTLDRQKWNTFVQQSPQGAVYVLAELMDVLYPNWQVFIIAQDQQWLAAFPLAIQQKALWKFALQPFPAQHWGILFAQDQQQNQVELSRTLRNALPRIHYFVQHFAPSFTGEVAFIEQGFDVVPRHTRHLQLSIPQTELWTRVQSSQQRQIKKFQKQTELIFVQGKTMQTMIAFLQQLFALGKDVSGIADTQKRTEYWDRLAKIGDYLIANQLGELLLIQDLQGNTHAAGLFSRFANKSIYLAGAVSEVAQSKGGMPALLWRAICDAQEKDSDIFDFEGSMIASIDHFFCTFGASKVPYVQIRRKRYL
jgi:hypothetical protein